MACILGKRSKSAPDSPVDQSEVSAVLNFILIQKTVKAGSLQKARNV